MKMGYNTEINWALKLKQDQGLDEKALSVGKEYDFFKSGERTYVRNMPIDLLNDDACAIAKVMIKKIMHDDSGASGTYTVLKIYEGIEKDVLTNYWRENLGYLTGKKIDDHKSEKFS